MGKVRGVRAVDEATKNVQVLASCPGHEFEPQAGLPHQRKFRCRRCQGEVDNQTHHWYSLGRRHEAAKRGSQP